MKLKLLNTVSTAALIIILAVAAPSLVSAEIGASNGAGNLTALTAGINELNFRVDELEIQTGENIVRLAVAQAGNPALWVVKLVSIAENCSVFVGNDRLDVETSEFTADILIATSDIYDAAGVPQFFPGPSYVPLFVRCPDGSTGSVTVTLPPPPQR
jgi:hypothetical protein